MATKSKRKRHVAVGYEKEDKEKKVKEEATAPSLPDSSVVKFQDVAVLPESGDNCGIARMLIPKGTKIRYNQQTFEVDYPILEGHRFAVETIVPGVNLTSWGLRFGVCSKKIEPGSYVSNAKMIESLRGRGITDLPSEPNFVDKFETHVIDEKAFKPAEQVPLHPESKRGFFEGYKRPDGRGVGTRNYVVLIGTTSLTGSFVRALEARVKEGKLDAFHNVDGVTSINHTECGGQTKPNNYDLVLRTLSGFTVHPNAGAVLLVDYGTEVLTGANLKEYMLEKKYPLNLIPHRFFTLSGDYEKDLKAGEALVSELLPLANKFERSKQPLTNLRVALQCGGSDAFSGVSGNPTVGWATMELIKHGGAAVLAETPELIGAEPYILQKVVDLTTAKKFISVVERYKRMSEFHGFTAEQNPSGGNNFRGLYNIALKSIGAGKKKAADTRLDDVLDYAEPLGTRSRGYYFMDSPGNDLESIAGEVATGCNFVFFITGNGSITNHPFAPTIKILTTTRRFDLLKKDMDFNAGRFQDAGVPIPELGMELFNMLVKSASGTRTIGEKAGHSQVVIWRNWANTEKVELAQFAQTSARSGKALEIKKVESPAPSFQLDLVEHHEKRSWDRIGLVLPTSLCSSEIARLITGKLNTLIKEEEEKKGDKPLLTSHVSRFVTLPHTEGCCVGYSHGGEQIYIRTMLGHLLHPNVHFALLLEHGCEKQHNDFMQGEFKKHQIDGKDFGYASVQVDGGLENVTEKVLKWFKARAESTSIPKTITTGLGGLVVGIHVDEDVPTLLAPFMATFARHVIAAGGSVVVPSTCTLLSAPLFLDDMLERGTLEPTLAFSQKLDTKKNPGYHIMDTPTDHWVETVTGLTAVGVLFVLTYTTKPLQGHPFIPVIQLTSAFPNRSGRIAKYPHADLVLEGDPDAESFPKEWLTQLLSVIQKVAKKTYTPKSEKLTHFQLARGKTAYST